MRLRFPEGMRSVVDATLALQGPASAPVLSGTVTVKTRAGRAGSKPAATCSRFGGRRLGAAGRARRDRADRDAAAALRRPHRRAVDAAHRERPGADCREQRSEPARHLRSAAALRPRRDRARRRALRRPPLSGHPRQPRLHQPQSDPAVLRHRGRDARARARADLSRHAAHGRHDRAAATGVQVRPAAGADRHPDAALQRHGAERRHRAGVAAAAESARAGPAAGARHAGAHRRAVGRGRAGRRADVRRRYVPDHAAPRSIRISSRRG